jgi:hypothetical protein
LEAAEESAGVMLQPEEEEEPEVQTQPEEGPEEEEPVAAKSELTVGAPGDRYEREANAVADRVMAMPEPDIQRQELEEEEPPEIQSQAEEEEESEVQAKGEATPVVTPAMRSELNASRGGGEPLSDDVRAFMEPRFGRDFSGVRVHAGFRAGSLAKGLRAQAFTRGSDIYFASGKCAPATAAGRRLVAHELAHTVQQTRANNGLREAPVIRRKVDPKKVSCAHLTRTASGRKRLKKLIGTTNPVGELQAADKQAIKMLDKVIKELRRNQRLIKGGALGGPIYNVDPFTGKILSVRRPIGVDMTMAYLLRVKLNIDGWDKKIWTSRRYLTRKGKPTVKLLLKRLGSVRRILNGGWIRYTCVGGKCHKLKARAYARPGRFRIYFCGRLWKTMKQANKRGLVLIHEAFHIAYGGTDRRRGIWSAVAIHEFVGDFNNVNKGKRL